MNVSKVSIITLTYKNWRLLDKAFASVSNQIIDGNFEVEYIVVDDGTEDFDIVYVEGILKKTTFNYQIIINPQNEGTVASFNNAIKKSTGDIIIPLSADDEFYDNNVVNDIVEEFNYTEAYVITGLRVPILNTIEYQPLPSSKDYFLFYNSKLLLKRLLTENIISGASTYYRRELFHKIGFFDTEYRLLEDYPFYIKLLSEGINISLLQRKVIKYGMSGVSSVNTINPILKSDFSRLHGNILIRSDLSCFERRSILYYKVMSKREKVISSWKYPDLFIMMILKKIFTLCKRIFTL